MRRVTTPADRIHALDIPLAQGSLLIPSSAIAEVVTISGVSPVPFAPPWCVGVVAWRTLAVPLVSFEAMLGGGPSVPQRNAKAVMFYPMPGRHEWEFVGVLAASEPRTRSLDPATMVSADANELPASPYVTGGIKVEGRVLFIPDFDAMQKVFYP